MIYKHELRRQRAALRFWGICCFLLVGLTMLHPPMWHYSLGMLLILTIPTAVLHARYAYVSAGLRIEISYSGFTAIYSQGHHQLRVDSGEVSEVVLHRARSIDSGGLQFSPPEAYWYIRLKTTDGRSLVVTCFTIDAPRDLLFALKSVKTVRRASLFCFPGASSGTK